MRRDYIKACDEETKEVARQIFNEIIRQNEFTPEAWKKVKIKVLHKKGDVENVGNYRSICSLLALYKLFSTILYGRLYPALDQKQAEDQAGFRKSYQTTDHLTFEHQETTEIKNRIRTAWATFHKYRQELTSKNYLLKHRLRLLDEAITPTICYASGTWAPTKEHE